MATTEPDTTPVDLAQEPMRRALAEQFSETPPTPPLKGCGPGRQLELGCFFDGTRNNRWMLDETSSETNVARLYDAYGSGARTEGYVERDKRYLVGVGAGEAQLCFALGREQPAVGTGTYAAATGFGGKFRVNMMYDWVKAKIEAHCRVFDPQSPKLIDVFGFSRGALSARTFVNLVNQALKTEPGPAFQNIEVRFLGVFDTVESVHWIERAEASNCHVTNSDYRAARHYTARHEIRENFPLTLLDPGAASVEYPGVHADVGGGYANGVEGKKNWLSFVTCYDMAAACRAQGIPMGAIPIPSGCDVGPESFLRSGSFRLVGRNSSDEELVASFVHVSHREYSLTDSDTWGMGAEPSGSRTHIRTTSMRLSARPPGFSWS